MEREASVIHRLEMKTDVTDSAHFAANLNVKVATPSIMCFVSGHKHIYFCRKVRQFDIAVYRDWLALVVVQGTAVFRISAKCYQKNL